MELQSPAKNIQIQALTPDILQSCILFSPVVTPSTELPAPVAIEEAGIITPIAPTVTYEGLPVVTILEDNSPDQIIGCLSKTGTSPQSRLTALFPGAVTGDGVVARDTNDIWVYSGSTWNNVGPNPGPRIVVSNIIPPYNSSIKILAKTSTRVGLRAFSYSLDLLAAIVPIRTSTKIGVKKSIITTPVPAGISVSTNSPSIITGFSAIADAASIIVGRPAITLANGSAIEVPSAGYSIQTYDVDVPRIATRVTTAPVSIAIATPTATASGGASTQPPASVIGVTPIVPAVNSFPLVSIAGTKTPILGASPSTATHTGWTSLQYGTSDDAFVQTPAFGFNFTINETAFSDCYVTSNGYITFGSGSTIYSGLSASNPALNKLFFVPGDRSYQRVSFKTEVDAQSGSKLARIRWEGSTGTSGTVGSSTIVAEITFFETQESGKQFVELVFGDYSPAAAGNPAMLIANPSTSYVTPVVGAGNTSWVFDGNATGTAWTLTTNRYVAPEVSLPVAEVEPAPAAVSVSVPTVEVYSQENAWIVLHFDGTSGSTFFENQAQNNTLTAEVYGSAAIATDYAKWGTGSGRFSFPPSGAGYTGHAVAFDDPVLAPGTGDFTIECWIYQATDDPIRSETIIQVPTSNPGQGRLRVDYSGELIWTGTAGELTHQTAITYDVWHHVWMVRESGTVKIALDGVQASSTLSDPTNYPFTPGFSGRKLLIGNSTTAGSSYGFGGRIDDLRYTVGEARALEVPTGPYSNW